MLNQVERSISSAKKAATKNRQFLTFCLESTHYCVDIHEVLEIRQYTEVTNIPQSEEYFIGVLDIRGTIVPIFDLKKLFNASTQENDSKKVIIIISLGEKQIGMVVDSVSDILEIPEEALKDVDAAKYALKQSYLSGVITHQGKMIMALNTNNIFTSQVLENINIEE